MKKVALYLKTPLLTLRGADEPIPAKASIIEGTLQEESRGGVYIETSAYYSIEKKSPREQERVEQKGTSVQIFVPMSKIDHMRIL